MQKSFDVEFLTRTAMATATEMEDRGMLADEQVNALVQALLGELGVRTPYPPIADAA